MRSRVPGALSLTVVGLCAALLAGCGDGSSTSNPTSTVNGDVTDLSKLQVDAKVGSAPAVTWDGVFATDKTTRRMLTEGKGGAVKVGQRVVVNYQAINGRTHKVFDSSFASKTPATFVLQNTLMKGLVTALDGAKVGSRSITAVAPGDGYSSTNTGFPEGVAADDTVLFVVDVVSAKTLPTRATGTPVTPRAGLPTVKLAANGAPTISMPKTKAPTTLQTQVLIKGNGPVVKKGQALTVQYTGAVWATGKVFDASWTKGASPASFEIGTGAVIKGWDQGLVGQTVGSQVLLVIPPDLGYGKTGQSQAGIKGTDTLVFVVDILDAG